MHLTFLKYGYISVRFTQWTRKSYAAFASLKIQVTMGHVCKGITEKALLKSKNCKTTDYISSISNNNTKQGLHTDPHTLTCRYPIAAIAGIKSINHIESIHPTLYNAHIHLTDERTHIYIYQTQIIYILQKKNTSDRHTYCYG